jgi:hypothetical protein
VVDEFKREEKGKRKKERGKGFFGSCHRELQYNNRLNDSILSGQREERSQKPHICSQLE